MLLWSQALGDVNIPVTPAGLVGGAVLQATEIQLDSGTKSATATGTSTATATLNKMAGNITSAALTTAAGGTWILTLTDSNIAVGDQVMVDVGMGTATTGTPGVASVTPGNGSVVIVVQNLHASAALNGTIIVAFVVFKN